MWSAKSQDKKSLYLQVVLFKSFRLPEALTLTQ